MKLHELWAPIIAWDFPIERQCLQIKPTYWFSTHWFRLCDLLWGQNSVAETKDWPFLYHLDGLGQTFRVRLVIRLKYKDGHKTHYACGRPFSQKFSIPVQTKWFVAAVYRRNGLLQPVAGPVHTEWSVTATCCCNLSPSVFRHLIFKWLNFHKVTSATLQNTSFHREALD